jgi:hypothetical protein
LPSYEPSKNLEDLHNRTAAMLARLALGKNPDLKEVLARVAALTGKRIVISPVGDQTWEAVTGLVLIRPTSATVLFRRTDPRWYQLHTVWHELSHLLFAHPGCGTLPGQHPGSRFSRRGQTILARGVTPVELEGETDFSDEASVIEAEAEGLAQRLSRVVLESPL